MNRVRRTLALVRASTPAVRSIVFSMRIKAAVAREVVARRHRTQAADLIYTALRVGRCPVELEPGVCMCVSTHTQSAEAVTGFVHLSTPHPPPSRK